MDACSKCQFWNPVDGYGDFGECRRHAPGGPFLHTVEIRQAPGTLTPNVIPEPVKQTYQHLWPVTKSTDICGEFAEKKKD